MAQNDILEHVGVLGMRWGHRKDEQGGAGLHAKKKVPTRREKKRAEKLAKKRAYMARNPKALMKNRAKLTPKEIENALAKFRWDKDLRALQRDEVQAGAQFANSVLAYGTTAAAAYTLYKSPMGQALQSQILKTQVGIKAATKFMNTVEKIRAWSPK